LQDASNTVPAAAAQVGNWDLTRAFARITLSGFGGALFWMQHVLVERRRWLTQQEFVELFAIAQLLPGVNGFNLAVLVGYHFRGWVGSLSALAGFVGTPVLVVIGIGVLHERYGQVPLVQGALTGMSAVAIGLLLATGARLTAVLGRHWRPWLFVLLAFAGVGVMRWPFLAVLAVLAPWAIVAAWREAG